MSEFDSVIVLLKKSIAKSFRDGETALTIRIEEIEQTVHLPHLDSFDQSQFKHEPLPGPGQIIKMFDIHHGNR